LRVKRKPKATPVEQDTEIEPIKEPEPKPRAKARTVPKRMPKTIVVDQDADVATYVDSNIESSRENVVKPNNKETVTCPNCCKVMAPKTLKYNHKRTCPAKDKTGVIKQQIKQPELDFDKALEQAIAENIKQVRKTRVQCKKDKFKELVAQAY